MNNKNQKRRVLNNRISLSRPILWGRLAPQRITEIASGTISTDASGSASDTTFLSIAGLFSAEKFAAFSLLYDRYFITSAKIEYVPIYSNAGGRATAFIERNLQDAAPPSISDALDEFGSQVKPITQRISVNWKPLPGQDTPYPLATSSFGKVYFLLDNATIGASTLISKVVYTKKVTVRIAFEGRP